MLKTLHNYTISELKDTLEKSVLYPNTKQAIFCTLEIFFMDFEKDKDDKINKFVYDNFIDSLMILFLKYTAFTSLNLFEEIDPLFDIIIDQKNINNRLETLFSIVTTLCKNYHSNILYSYRDITLNKYKKEENGIEDDIQSLKDKLFLSLKNKKFISLFYADEIDKRNDISLEDKIKLIFHTFEDVYYSEGIDMYDHTERYSKWYSRLYDYSDRFLIYYNPFLVRLLNYAMTEGKIYTLSNWKKIVKNHLKNDKFKLQKIETKDIIFDFFI